MSPDRSNPPFFVRRPALLSSSQLEQMEEAMMRILEDIGIAVLNENIVRQLVSCGFSTKDNRILIERKLVREFLDEERKSNGNRFSEEQNFSPPKSNKITLSVSEYPQHIHDIETDSIVPFTTERLIEATKLLDLLTPRGIISRPPGCPSDIPPQLQPVMQYWIGALYSKNGQNPVEPKSLRSFSYIMKMAEVLGKQRQSITIYVFSPLTLGGESLRCVMEFKDSLSIVRVSAMPSVGCTAPINIGDAVALSAAEVIGASILTREIIDLPVNWHLRLCSIDLHSLAMSLGSPEDFLLQLVNYEINAYFHGTTWYPAAGIIHTNAKLPGAQACAEKSSLMTAGALLGQRNFGVAGTLSLDEVFSPEQLLYDLEIKDHVQQIVKGINGECDPERCVNDIREAIEQGSFVGLETTLKDYKDVYWGPKLFERQFLAAWQGEGSVSIRKRTHEMVRELSGQHDYELDSKLRMELDKILAKAKEEFS